MNLKRLFLFTSVLAVACLLTSTLTLAQSLTTGEITGTVTDPSGAVIPNVELTLKSVEKGYTQTGTTNSQGAYRFALLAPGNYTITASAPGFRASSVSQAVSVGAISITNIKVEVGATGTTVEVSGVAPLLQTDSSEINTTMNTLAVQTLPNPGNDLTFIAQTAPGSTMNTEMGYGNFSSFGISATSNLFTLNGMYDNDPFLNLNNSGATNLLLGNNEIQEATVVSNGYSGQYGGFAGAQVNYVTKSGSDQWHGNAAYWWNGRAMNANDWFANDTVPATPRSFVNANQYAGSFGGPIVKDKAFFFFNYEGLRVLIPTSVTVNVPSQAFETATLNNLTAIGQGAQIPFYQNMFNLYNGAPRSGPLTPVAGGCYDVATDALAPIASGCTNSFRSNISNLTHEFLLAGRFDFNLTNNDKLFIRAQEDKGLQATITDPINSLFNTQSNQPEYQTQISWNHVFGAKAVNNVVVSATYYSAIFGNADSAATLAAFPTSLLMADGSMTTLGGADFNFPQGRNVTQYQVVDDYSYNLGTKHTLKLGLNFHRYDIGDHDFGVLTSGITEPLSLDAFYNGGLLVPNSGPNEPIAGATTTVMEQSFPTALAQPISIYGLGWYVQDDWKVTPSLKLTLDLRMDHPSNPVCQTNCFARLTSAFDNLDHSVDIPYNQAINAGVHQAIPNFTAIEWQPRIGFAWTPFGLKNTVLRGGFGIFGDTFQGFVSDVLAENPPLDNTFLVNSAPISNTVPGNLFALASQSNTSFVNGFKAGQTLAQIQAADPFFAPPNMGNVAVAKVPMYEEYNLDLQQGIGNNTTLDINYVGNHGYHETAQFNALNAFNNIGTFTALPATPIDPRFTQVNQLESVGVSNYNGVTLSVQHHFNHGLQLQGNFTWSHALDEISNGGLLPFNAGTNVSPVFPTNPNNIRSMYGNADYDTRKYASISYVYQVPYRFGPKPLLSGWQLSGTLFARSGLPYTVRDGATSTALSSAGYGATLFANFDGAAQPNCGTGAASATPGAELNPCLLASSFTPASTGYGDQRRNQFFGPGYFDTDFTVMKYTNIPHWEQGKIGLGVQFFNLFNHSNFDQPDADLSHTTTFGQILRTVNTPTSVLGSFLGGDASPRLIQLTAKLNF